MFDPEPREVNALTPVIKDVNITGIIGRNVQGAGIYMYGLPELPIKNVTISNVNFDITGSEKGFSAVMAYDRELSYGEGIFLENTENINMNNINISCVAEKLTLKNSKDIFLKICMI